MILKSISDRDAAESMALEASSFKLQVAPVLSSRATLSTLLHLFFCPSPLPNLLLFVHPRNWIPTLVESSCHGTYNVGDLRAHASNPILPGKSWLSRSGSALWSQLAARLAISPLNVLRTLTPFPFLAADALPNTPRGPRHRCPGWPTLVTQLRSSAPLHQPPSPNG
jgi:hypothetical protein